MVNVISIQDLRPKLSHIVKKIHDRFDRYVITRRGQPEVVMISIEDYESFLETLEVESDKKLIHRIKTAEKDLRLGKGTLLEEIHRELKIV